MKKLMMFLCLTVFVGIANGQTLHVSLVDEFVNNETKLFCADTLIVYVDSACWLTHWYRVDYSEEIESYELIVTESEHQGQWGVYSPQCDINMYFTVYISSPTSNAFNPFDEPFVWKRRGDTITLGNPDLNYLDWQWSTNETTTTIDVVQDGTYSATNVNDPCGPRTYPIEVYNNVELTSASCDLATGYNMLEWETTAQQATYVQSVNIYFDYDEGCNYTVLVGNVPYNEGGFVDYTHDSYQYPCQYHVVAVGYDGMECPLRSYWCRTISLADLMGSQGTQTLQWTSYTTERDVAKHTTSVLAYQIFDVINGEAFYKATVGSFANTYNYDPNDFNGHGGVAAVLDGAKDGEIMAFARTQYKIGDPDGTNENHNAASFIIYPNPATGIINIRAMEQGNELNLTIVNSMGQVIYSGVVNGVYTTPRLTPGIYTVIADGNARKVVVQ